MHLKTPQNSVTKVRTSCHIHCVATSPNADTSPVFAWYHAHSLPVIPINPSRPEISLPSKTYSTVKSPSTLPSPTGTALSFITPPLRTRQILGDAKSAGVKSVWLQPGSFDEEGIKYAKENFENVVGGFERGTRGEEGWCVLVDGEAVLEQAGRQWKGQKL